MPWTAPSSNFSASTDMKDWEVGTNLDRFSFYFANVRAVT